MSLNEAMNALFHSGQEILNNRAPFYRLLIYREVQTSASLASPFLYYHNFHNTFVKFLFILTPLFVLKTKGDALFFLAGSTGECL